MRYRLLFPMLLLCMQLAPAARAAEMGRLFNSPHARDELDRLRERAGKAGGDVDQATLDGFVRSSSGSTTAWVNGQAQHGVVVNAGTGAPRVSLHLPGGENVQLKAGQTADLKQGTVREQLDKNAASSPGAEGR
jgi:hypothetical protein